MVTEGPAIPKEGPPIATEGILYLQRASYVRRGSPLPTEGLLYLGRGLISKADPYAHRWALLPTEGPPIVTEGLVYLQKGLLYLQRDF